MFNTIPAPDSPDGDYWARVVVPKINKGAAEQRAKDLRYAARCDQLEIRRRGNSFHSYFEVCSVNTVKRFGEDGRAKTKKEFISQHRATARADAESFMREAEQIKFASKRRL